MQQGGVLGTPVRNEFDAKVRLMCKVTSALPTGEMELIRNIDALSIVCMGVQCMLRSNGGAGTNQVISFIRNHPSITQIECHLLQTRPFNDLLTKKLHVWFTLCPTTPT